MDSVKTKFSVKKSVQGESTHTRGMPLDVSPVNLIPIGKEHGWDQWCN